jgi:hypothetical protein
MEKMTDSSSMMHVSLISDFTGAIPSGTMIVRNDGDYILAAKKICDSAVQKKSVEIWVQKKAHYTWLQAFAQSVDLPIEFEEKTPRLILADLWQVTIPDWLKDKQVIEQNLLDIKLPEQKYDDFINAMLAALLGECFSKNKLNAKDIPTLLNIALPDNKLLFHRYTVLHRCLEQKCVQWQKTSNEPWMEKICAALQKDPDLLWQDLSLWLILNAYPEKLLAFELPPHRIALVQQLPPKKLNALQLHDIAVDKASQQVNIFLNDVKKNIKTTQDLEKIISCCSGKLHTEFVSLTQILQDASLLVDKKLLESIKQKFASCPGVSTINLSSLNSLIVPDIPSIRSDRQHQDVFFWKDWTIKEYIPYRNWLVENNKENIEVENSVSCFSDWYIENYTDIHQKIDTSLVHLLSSWSDQISNDKLSLIIVVDCLPFTYFDLLVKAFRERGLHKHEQGVRFAPLPSNTETCKTLLFSGDWHVDKKLSYGKILDQRVKATWPEKNAVYLSGLQTMAALNISDEESVVYVLNYIPSDEIMHSNPGLKGMTYDDELFNCFIKLAESAQSFIQRTQKVSRDISIYVTTDHGATKIIESERENFDSTIVNDVFENSKHRFAAIDKNKADNIPDNLWDIGYRFNQPFGNSDVTYFIPRGHKTAGTKKKAKGYVHGGATPEEIIVPVAIFKTIESKWKEPLGRFVNVNLDPASQAAVFHVQRLEEIEIAIQNPNIEPLRVIRAEIVKPETSELRMFNSCEIDNKSEKKLKIKCYFNKVAINTNELSIRFIYYYGEEKSELIFSLKSIFKTAMTGGFSLKNL